MHEVSLILFYKSPKDEFLTPLYMPGSNLITLARNNTVNNSLVETCMTVKFPKGNS